MEKNFFMIPVILTILSLASLDKDGRLVIESDFSSNESLELECQSVLNLSSVERIYVLVWKNRKMIKTADVYGRFWNFRLSFDYFNFKNESNFDVLADLELPSAKVSQKNYITKNSKILYKTYIADFEVPCDFMKPPPELRYGLTLKFKDGRQFEYIELTYKFPYHVKVHNTRIDKVSVEVNETITCLYKASPEPYLISWAVDVLESEEKVNETFSILKPNQISIHAIGVYYVACTVKNNFTEDDFGNVTTSEDVDETVEVKKIVVYGWFILIVVVILLVLIILFIIILLCICLCLYKKKARKDKDSNETPTSDG
ncbi:hypothetical protein HELRODRAFT_179715 [Helobdella robusta]|uniref:Ig-like domain-containing protein n=1 Tax=Helobdella robusta TaxID=6412 RepID=T1FF24_HELRO|nr:hypothetical protein HELRODRAFT_179715 [Helobdella robusta]ESN95122.1 hypothetical protein HELRODRAFT_179715 [Helobdella robusta]